MDNSNPWTGKSSAEDLEIEQAEHRLSDPGSANMQFLQSTLINTDAADASGVGVSPWAAPSKPILVGNPPSSGFSGLAPAYSGVGLVGVLAGGDLSGMNSALGISSAVASAAPATMGKTTVGDGAALAALGSKALSPSLITERFADSLPLMRSLADAQVPLSPEYAQLMAMLGSPLDESQLEPLQNLLVGAGTGASAENLQDAIDAVMDQISLLNSTFEPLMDGFAGDVQSQTALMSSLPSTDLGLNILSDADSVSTALTDLLGSVDAGSSQQISGLLNLGSALDEVLAVVDSLPTLDGITDPVTGIVDGITDPVTGIVDGITDPVTGIVDGITDPVTGIVDGITDPVTGIVDGITDPVTGIVDGLPGLGLLSGFSTSGASEGNAGLLDGLSSGISSAAGAEGGALDGVLGTLDSNKSS
ncbi:MAG TPA: hypothetical protein VFV43_06320 [Limnobacter sp.]|nr:hypothetical protein [Limnobacter sp.]